MRPSYFNLLNLGTPRRMFENVGPGHGLASRTAEVTSGCMQSGSSSQRRRNLGAAAHADAIGEKQLCTETCPAPDDSRRRTRGSS